MSEWLRAIIGIRMREQGMTCISCGLHALVRRNSAIARLWNDTLSERIPGALLSSRLASFGLEQW